MWQYIAITIVGILVTIHLIRKVYSFFSTGKKEDKCAGCCGCPLGSRNS